MAYPRTPGDAVDEGLLTTPLDRRRFLGATVLATTGGLVALALPRRTLASEDELSLFPTLRFWEVPRGQSREEHLLLYNGGADPVTLLDVTIDRPEFTVLDFDAKLDPGTLGTVRVRFKPEVDNRTDATLSISLSGGWPLAIPVSGRTSDLIEVPLEESLELRLLEGATIVREEGVRLTYTVELPPVGPTAADATVELSLGGTLPPGVEIDFARTALPAGGRELVSLDLFAPRGTPPVDSQIYVIGDVRIGGEATFTATSNSFLVPGPVIAQAADPCECDGPDPTLNELDRETMEIPDAQPAPGTEPSDHPVALATAILKGPKSGECCPGARFEMTLTVDSEVGGNNESLTAYFLLAGLCDTEPGNSFSASAETNGTSQGIDRGSGDSGLTCADLANQNPRTTPRAVIETKRSVDVDCSGPEWPCKVPENDFKTTLTLSGPEAGAIEVHWKITIGGKECLISSVTGTIEQIVYLHESDDTPPKTQVYSPDKDDFYDKTADPDGDGRSNYDEVREGKDPESKD